MKDPFKAFARTERIKAGLWLFVLAVSLAAIAFIFSRARNPQGTLIGGRVESFGVTVNKWGDMVVTVRLADGQVREVLTKWDLVRGCKRGDRIALVQRGTALNVDITGCNFRE